LIRGEGDTKSRGKKIDAFVTSRHSREGGSPEDLRKTGFPHPRE